MSACAPRSAGIASSCWGRRPRPCRRAASVIPEVVRAPAAAVPQGQRQYIPLEQFRSRRRQVVDGCAQCFVAAVRTREQPPLKPGCGPDCPRPDRLPEFRPPHVPSVTRYAPMGSRSPTTGPGAALDEPAPADRSGRRFSATGPKDVDGVYAAGLLPFLSRVNLGVEGSERNSSLAAPVADRVNGRQPVDEQRP